MIEKVIYDYLSGLLGFPVAVFTEDPLEPPASYCLIEKTGGAMDDKIKESTIAVQSYASTLYDAMMLNETVKDVMLNGLISLDTVSGVKLNSDYNYTDTATKRYRYQAVFVINHY